MKVPINPKLPRYFDDTPNDERPASHQRWWHRPFIVTQTIEEWDAWYANRTDKYAQGARDLWAAQGRPKWLRAYPSGTRYEVRCLDGGAWDRSTCWGEFATLDLAMQCAGGARIGLRHRVERV